MEEKFVNNKKPIVSEYSTGEVFISWAAPEYEYHQKSTDWYWWVSLFALILFIFAVWQQSFLFSILVLLGWVTTIIFAVRPPLVLDCTISERGIRVGKKMYSWHDLKSFWIFYNPPMRKDLTIILKQSVLPPLNIHVGDADPMKIRSIMLNFIPEIEQEESLVDSLARLIRF